MRITEWVARAGWLLAIVIPMQTQAQTVTGTILGTVSDTSGARIAGIAVTAVNDLTQEKRTATTNGMGDYLVNALPVGSYRVEVESQGFGKAIVRVIFFDSGAGAFTVQAAGRKFEHAVANSGRWQTAEFEIDRAIFAADAAGAHIAIHAAGDLTLHMIEVSRTE